MNRVIIERIRLLTTNYIIYSAWEKSEFSGKHSTITSFSNYPGWYGRIGTNPDESKFNHLIGGSSERIAAVRAAYEEKYRLAYDLIIKAFPESIEGKQSSGEITLISNTLTRETREINLE